MPIFRYCSSNKNKQKTRNQFFEIYIFNHSKETNKVFLPQEKSWYIINKWKKFLIKNLKYKNYLLSNVYNYFKKFFLKTLFFLLFHYRIKNDLAHIKLNQLNCFISKISHTKVKLWKQLNRAFLYHWFLLLRLKHSYNYLL